MRSFPMIQILPVSAALLLAIGSTAFADSSPVEPLRLEARGDQICETRASGDSIACYLSVPSESSDFVPAIRIYDENSPGGSLEHVSSEQLDEIALAFFMKAGDRAAIVRDFAHLSLGIVGFDPDRVEPAADGVVTIPFVATLDWERVTGEKGSYNVKGVVRTVPGQDVPAEMDGFLEGVAKQFSFERIDLASGAAQFAPGEDLVRRALAPAVYGSHLVMPVLKAFIRVFENILQKP